MKTASLINIFLRSLSIQGSYNFRRMQNIGFAYTMLPLVRLLGKNESQISGMLVRHTQVFNTHPYLSGPVVGTVAGIEESSGNCPEAGKQADAVKYALMAPYSGMGDSFFWGALRPLSSIASVTIALMGVLAAPLIFLALYTPLHVWIRLKGFFESYRRGRDGIEFIRDLNLPQAGNMMRWISLVLAAFLAAYISVTPDSPFSGYPSMTVRLTILVLILLCFLLIRKRLSAVFLLYGIFVASFVMSL